LEDQCIEGTTTDVKGRLRGENDALQLHLGEASFIVEIFSIPAKKTHRARLTGDGAVTKLVPSEVNAVKNP
jgi:hypothetical protein